MSASDTSSIDISDNGIVAGEHDFATAVNVRPKQSPSSHNRDDPAKSLAFSINYQYFNSSGTKITAVFRDGMQYTAPSVLSDYHRSFIIRKEIYLNARVAPEVNNFLNTLPDDIPLELEDFRELFQRLYSPSDRTALIPIDYEVPYSLLKANEGSVYVRELDIILTANQDNIPLHPGSSHAEDIRQLDSNPSAIHVELISNSDKIIGRVIRLGEMYISVISQRSSTKTDGLRIYYSTPTGQRSNKTKNVVSQFSLEEMDHLPFIYKSREEAELAPSNDVISALELKKLDHGTKQLVHQHAREKLEWETSLKKAESQAALLNEELANKERIHKADVLEMDRRRQELEHSMKIERMRATDYYDSRSAVRKDSTELIKTTPALILGVGAVVATLIKVIFK